MTRLGLFVRAYVLRAHAAIKWRGGKEKGRFLLKNQENAPRTAYASCYAVSAGASFTFEEPRSVSAVASERGHAK